MAAWNQDQRAEDKFLKWQYHTLRQEIETSKDRHFKITAGTLILVPAIELLTIAVKEPVVEQGMVYHPRGSHVTTVDGPTCGRTDSLRVISFRALRDNALWPLHTRIHRTRRWKTEQLGTLGTLERLGTVAGEYLARV